MSSSLSSELSQDGSSKRKALLTRSNAMCGDDDTRFRPPNQLEQCGGGLSAATPLNSRSKHYSTASTVSRDSSHTDYTDSTGIDLMQFIVNTLHKNAKDREMLLSLESEMRKFVLDKSRQAYKFPKMSSYNRMLVHRVAAFFGLDHNIDRSGTLVVVTKTANTRIPELEFAKCIKNNLFTDRLMFRRNVQSFDECQLNSMYANLPAVHPNIGYGSAAAMPAVGGPSLPPSLDLVRRARSFEVGEWHNSMASGENTGSTAALLPGVTYLNNHSATGLSGGGGGASSSNSSSSWQLAGGGGGAVPYSTSRPDSIVSPGGGILVDANSAVYYAAHPPPQTQLIVTNNAQPSAQPQADYSQRNGSQGGAPKITPTDGQSAAPFSGYVLASQFYAAPSPNANLPVFYVQAGGNAATAPSVPFDYTIGLPPSYYVAQYPAIAVPNAYEATPTQPVNQQQQPVADMDAALTKQFQQSVRVGSSDTNASDRTPQPQPQMIPYNTPAGVCYIMVGSCPATVYLPQTSQNEATPTQAVPAYYVAAQSPADAVDVTTKN